MYNDIIKFITDNSVVLVALGITIIGVFSSLVSRNKQKIYASLPQLITEAQALEASNHDKFQHVLDIAYGSTPKIFRFFISEQDIERAIEYTLNKIKAYAKEESSPKQMVKPIDATQIQNGAIDQISVGAVGTKPESSTTAQ